MDDARNYDIKWDLEEDINTVSQYVKISGDVWQGKEVITVSGDVEVSWNNLWNIKTVSGEVELLWMNSGKIETISWDIEVWNWNNKHIATTSWSVEIQWDNQWKISSVSGKIDAEFNSWYIKTTSWDISLEWNAWEITTNSGRITIGDDFTAQLRGFNVNISGSNNVVINNSEWKNISVINGEVFIDWIKQTNEWGDISEKILELWELSIDVSKQQIFKWGQEITLSDANRYWYEISEDFSKFAFQWQQIYVTDTWMKILGS